MVKYLNTTKKQKIPYCVSYSALAAWKEETGHGIEQLESELTVLELEPLFFLSLKSGHRMTETEFVYEKNTDEYLNLIDDVWFQFVADMPDFFTDVISTEHQQLMSSRKKKKQ